jgi:hypothetical protein
MYNFHPVVPVVIEHVSSMATTSKGGINHKLFSIQEKQGIIHALDAAKILLAKDLRNLHFCVKI